MTITFAEYANYSYAQASHEGLRLVQKAAKDENWFHIGERLVALRSIMDAHFMKAW